MFTTTLNQIRSKSPCQSGWTKLLKGLGKTGPDDEPLPLTRILEINGLDDAIWCLRTLEGVDREIRLFAVGCARQVQHLMTDPRSLAALEVAERFANGQATREELNAAYAASSAAYAASWNAAYAASSAAYAAYAAAYAAARAAADAASWDAASAARAAAWDAARAAAWDAASAARAAAWDAARAAAWDAARAAAWAVARAAAWAVASEARAAARTAARDKQEQLFRQSFS